MALLTLSGQVTERTIAADRVITHVTNYMSNAASQSGKSKELFTVDGGTTGPYTRNANLWLSAVNFSCVPVKMSYFSGTTISNLYRGCLVTPIHLLTANHAGPVTGDGVYFLGADNTVYFRTILSQNMSVGNDVVVNRLSSALPSAVTPAKILPSNFSYWSDNVDNNDFATGFPVAALDQELKVVARRWNGISAGFAQTITETTSPMSTFGENIVPGDSGSPVFITINGAAVLVYITFGASGANSSGAALHTLRTSLDLAIAAIGGGHSLESVDLTGFAA